MRIAGIAATGLLLALSASAADRDGDGIEDPLDNCLEIPNPDQINDSVPPDVFGNACDGDFDRNGDVDGADFLVFRGCWGAAVNGLAFELICDHDGDRTLDDKDFRLFKTQFLLGSPGPSGLPE